MSNTLLTPPTVAVPETAEDDPRLGHLLGRALEDAGAARTVLVGFPCDEGVRRNGGRVGAAAAPEAIRRHLYRLTPDARDAESFADLLAHTVDLGDVVQAETMEASQERLGAVLGPHLARGAFVIVLGGGHETAYGHFLGYVGAGRPVEIVNIDAHADVRPLRDGRGHSGSPFRQALDHPSGRCAGYAVAGLAPHSTAAAHVDVLRAHGARFFWRADVTPALLRTLLGRPAEARMVTLDIDAVDQAAAPGVSAPAAHGLPADLWLAAAYEAGRAPHVTSVDLVEVNPAADEGGRTARLAALTVWHVLRGLAHRLAESSIAP